MLYNTTFNYWWTLRRPSGGGGGDLLLGNKLGLNYKTNLVLDEKSILQLLIEMAT